MEFHFSLIKFVLIALPLANSAPNIIFILFDDVGWADFNYNVKGHSAIPTPNLDKYANKGLKLTNHYVHSSCTPSRASLMTGRYASNTGLPCAMFPGSVAGLPESMATLPQLLRKAGYSAHMVGKWHVGHSQWKQGPVGRGFESHVGSLMWNLESYTKLMWKNPFSVVGADWGRYYENGSYSHYAESRHATIALTGEALTRMEEHRAEKTEKPLFLYVSFNAAHTPLQAEQEWLDKCSHIPHLWRRNYCGLMVGLDQAVDSIIMGAQSHLGEDTMIVVTSDNGGATWFGGLNQPLRAGKLTPFEGGVKVPGFIVDLSKKYTMLENKEFHHMFHISDWLPTFLSWAEANHLVQDLHLDGMDQSKALNSNTEIRNHALLELFTENESHDGSESISYRKGKYKIIKGTIRDPHWYQEPTEDRVFSTDDGYLKGIIERTMRFFENWLGDGPMDVPFDIVINMILFQYYAKQEGLNVLLYDLDADPSEEHNIAVIFPEIVNELLVEIEVLKMKRPHHPKYWMMSANWTQGFIPGSCANDSLLTKDQCKFAHHWIPDSSDILDEKSLGLEDAFQVIIREDGPVILMAITVIVLSPLLCLIILRKLAKLLFSSGKQKIS